MSDWHALSPTQAANRLAVDLDGLTSAEAVTRFGTLGPNLLPKPPPPAAWRIWLGQFLNPLVLLLVAAAVVAAAVGDHDDAGFIAVVILINAAIGAFLEIRAARSIASLDAMIAERVAVVRDGVVVEIAASALVPGDVVRLEAGMKVPADLRLIAADDLQIAEAALTGESVPVAKGVTAVAVDALLADRASIAHAGTVVARGTGLGLVVETAARTAIGQLAGALATLKPTPAPLVVMLERLTERIAIGAIALLPVVAAALYLNGEPLVSLFFLCVALAISAIPEGLPIAITIVLAIAAQRMAERNVIAKGLPTVEGLGSCTMLVTDKTGTITLNQLTVVALWLPGAGEVALDRPEAAAALATAARCTDAVIGSDGVGTGDPVDLAILRAAGVRDGGERVATIPYDPARRFAAVALPDLVAKGAVETILELTGEDGASILAAAEALASAGQRVIAVAAGTGGIEGTAFTDPRLMVQALIGIEDPLRADAAATIAAIQAAGVGVVMATGDHPLTALAIARKAGIAERPEQVLSGAELRTLGQSELAERLAVVRVCARVEPLQKVRVVKALHDLGHRVAVTGDGANDAPALEIADIGVAMGRAGTDVARSTADLILTDDRLASLADGIREGRTAFANLQKVVLFLLAMGLSEVLLFVGCVLLGAPPPLVAVQLLWLNVVTDSFLHIGLALDPAERGVSQNRPRDPTAPILSRAVIERIFVLAAPIGFTTGALVFWWLDQGLPIEEVRSLALLQLLLVQNAMVLALRSPTRSILQPVGRNPFIALAILGSLGLHALATLWAPLAHVLGLAVPPADALLPMAAGAVLALLPDEVLKAWRRRAD